MAHVGKMEFAHATKAGLANLVTLTTGDARRTAMQLKATDSASLRKVRALANQNSVCATKVGVGRIAGRSFVTHFV